MAANALFKKRLDEIQAKAPADKEWWEKRRTSIQAELFQEEGIDSPVATPLSVSSKAGSEDDAILVEAVGTAGSDKGSIRKKKGKK